MATQVTTGLLANDAVTDAKLHADFTATTQSASDNSTSVATTAYVTTAIANLADSAPSTLNTLNELAAALGDDANFSTTVTNSIATKAPLASPSFTGNVGIGESSPDAPLHITSNTPIISFDESDASQEFRLGSFGGAFALYDSTDSAYRLTVDGSGNVGIGVTSMTETFVVSGDTNITGQMYLGPEGGNRRPFAKASNWGYSSGYRAVVLGSASATYHTDISGAVTLSFNYDPSGNSNGSFSGNGNEILFRNGTQFVTPNSADDAFNLQNLVLKDGKVGVGSTAPDGQLHVKGSTNKTVKLDPTFSSGTHTSLAFARNGTDKWRVFQNSSDDYLSFYNDQNTSYDFSLTDNSKIFVNVNPNNFSAYGGLGHLIVKQTANDLGIGIINSGEDNTLKLVNNGTVAKIEHNGAIPIQIKNANGVLAEFDTYAIPKMNFHFAYNNIYAVSTTNDELGNGQGVLMLKQQISVSAGSKIIVWYDSGQILNNNQGGNGSSNSNPQIAIYVTTNSSAPPNRGADYMINGNTDHFMYPMGGVGAARVKMNGMGATGTLSTGGTYYIYMYGGGYNSGSYSFNYQDSSSNTRGSSIIWAEVMA